MNRIRFNKRYGLEDAVIAKLKDMTRRDGTKVKLQYEAGLDVRHDRNGKRETLEEYAIRKSPYKIGEEVAVAQSYEDIKSHLGAMARCMINPFGSPREHPGWTNKMFVRADLMPHSIKITGIRFERLKCISEEECLREGIIIRNDMINCNMEDIVRYTFKNSFENHIWKCYKTAREAFAVLIDKLSGKGYWESNPFVYVFTFKLVC